MVKIIIEMIAIFLAICFISGFSKGRRLEVEKGKEYPVGIGKNILFYVNGRRIPWFLSYFPLFWPLRHIYQELEWTEVEDIDKENEKILVDDGKDKNGKPKKKEERKYKSVQKLPEIPSKFLGGRKEKVPFLLEYEPVTYWIKLKDKLKNDYIFEFTIILYLYKPKKTTGKPDFKMLGQKTLESNLRPWANKETPESIYDTNTELIKDPDCGIQTSDGLDLVTYLNRKVFKQFGLRIYKIELNIIASGGALELFNLMRESARIEQETKNANLQVGLVEAQNKVELTLAQGDAAVAAVEFNAYGDGVEKLASAIFENKAKVQKNVLFKVEHEADKTGEVLAKEGMAHINSLSEQYRSRRKSRKEEENENAA